MNKETLKKSISFLENILKSPSMYVNTSSEVHLLCWYTLNLFCGQDTINRFIQLCTTQGIINGNQYMFDKFDTGNVMILIKFTVEQLKKELYKPNYEQ